MTTKSAVSILCAVLAGVSWAGAASHCPRFESAPEAVRKTVISEARGGTVDEMEILRIEGRTIYIAEIERRYEAHRQRAAEEIDKFCQEHRWNCVDVTENASYKAKNLALHGFPKL